MSAEPVPHEQHLHAAPEELADLRLLRTRLDELDAAQAPAALVGPDGERVSLPASAFAALRAVVDGMARGETLTLIPQGTELTTQQAADLLHLSRPYLVRLLDAGEIPHHRVGTHRRVRVEDVLAYRERRDGRRRDALRELTRLSEELPGGYR